MLFRTHIVFSLAVFLLLDYLFEIEGRVLFLIFVLFGTVFVDIDSRKSKVGNKWFFRPLQFVMKHRGGIHSLLFAVLISLVVAIGSRWAGIGFFVGYVSHLLLDSLTPAGIRLFWPLSDWKLSFRIRSGGMFEDIIFVLLLLGNVFFFGKMVFYII